MAIITERQKAALLFHVLTGCKDRETLFRIAEGDERCNKLKDSSKSQTFSTWFNSQTIQEALKEIIYKVEQEKKQIAEKATQEYRRKEIEGAKNGTIPTITEDLNFLDLETFLREANKQANQITDDKEKRAWLELIGKYMSFKDRNEADEVEIKRFYTPVECEKCEIYNKCKECKLSECPNMQ